MITVQCYEPGAPPEELRDPEDISEVVGRDGRLVWVDLQDPDDDDFTMVQKEFELHPLAMEDARNHGQRPKLEQYPTHAFIVAYSSELAEVDIFIGPDWIVTVRGHNEQGEEWSLAECRARFERTCPRQPTSGFLVYTLLDSLVDGYFDATDRAEDVLEELEDSIFSEVVAEERDVQQHLFQIRRRLLVFRRAVVPLREVVASLLRREVKWIDDDTITHLQDVYDHVLRAIDLLDGQRELMGNAVDAHLAIISNRMNLVMKKMTSWGAILLGSTLVAGIYGMNFNEMPELRWQYGYAMAIGLMVVITVAGYWFFRRKDWL
jgi:magnesium transporter